MKSIIRKIALSFVSPLSQLQLTSEFNEVYFSERRNFEATHKIPTSKNKFGWRNLQGFGTVKFLLKSFLIRSVGKLRPQSYDVGALVVLSNKRSDTSREIVKGHTHVKSS